MVTRRSSRQYFQKPDFLVDRENGLISREIFVNPDLYEREQERVFARCWLFVGFEDQVSKPGDFFVSRMGEESVILTRDRQGEIHVFLNSCRHRGMKVCRYDDGNTPVFTCPHHGWSYGLAGELVGVPHFKTAYHSQLNKDDWGLAEVAQLANFKGSIWATWDPTAPPFKEYLGDHRLGLGLFFDKEDGSEADIEVVGVYKWTLPNNWKFGAENFGGDGYHTRPTHRSRALLAEDGGAGGVGRGNWLTFMQAHHGSGRTQLNIVPDEPSSGFGNSPILREYYREVYERRKANLGHRWRLQASLGNIFPNASQGQSRSMCVWHPNGVHSTEAWRFWFVDRDAPEEVKEIMRHPYMETAGPQGLTEQDDMENWNYAHKASRGVIARRLPYNYAMGMGYELKRHPALDELGVKVDGYVFQRHEDFGPSSEQNQRGAYYFWADLMESESWAELRARGRWP